MRIGQFYQQQSAPNLESQLQILAWHFLYIFVCYRCVITCFK
jgi:hypothetical protein